MFSVHENPDKQFKHDLNIIQNSCYKKPAPTKRAGFFFNDFAQSPVPAGIFKSYGKEAMVLVLDNGMCRFFREGRPDEKIPPLRIKCEGSALRLMASATPGGERLIMNGNPAHFCLDPRATMLNLGSGHKNSRAFLHDAPFWSPLFINTAGMALFDAPITLDTSVTDMIDKELGSWLKRKDNPYQTDFSVHQDWDKTFAQEFEEDYRCLMILLDLPGEHYVRSKNPYASTDLHYYHNDNPFPARIHRLLASYIGSDKIGSLTFFQGYEYEYHDGPIDLEEGYHPQNIDVFSFDLGAISSHNKFEAMRHLQRRYPNPSISLNDLLERMKVIISEYVR